MKTIKAARNHSFRSGLLPLAFCFLLLPIATLAATSSHVVKPSAKFDREWIDYGVTRNGQLGMLIHLKFTVYELKGVDSQVRIKFQDSQSNDLKDTNKSFYTENGNVAVFDDLKPGYEPTDYNDLQIFMPYSELDITRAGKYNLKMDVDLIYEDGTFIEHLTYYDFEYTRSAPTSGNTDNPAGVTAKFDSVWIDYNVTQGGQLGMRIHNKFTVYSMKGINGAVRMRFEKADGTFLKSTDGSFEDNDGEVAANEEIKPGYEPTVYNDLDTFMPYSELHLGPGKYNLKMDVDLVDGSGGLIAHMTYYDLVYTKNN
jgi:hypothetical protein